MTFITTEEGQFQVSLSSPGGGGYVGDKGEYAAYASFSQDTLHIFLATATGSGYFGKGHIFMDTDGSGFMKICLYSTAGSAVDPQHTNNVLLGSTDAFAISSTGGWYSSVNSIGGPASLGTSYWIVAISSVTSNYPKYEASARSDFYIYSPGFHASPLANLGSLGFNENPNSKFGIWVEIN